MRLTEEGVRKLFSFPYQSALDAGAKSVMASFSSWNGTKMHASEVLVDGCTERRVGT
jgi:beta-glucosidase